MVWYSISFRIFQFVVVHTVKGFCIVNKEDVFLELSYFFSDPMDVGNLISGSSAFSKSSLNIWKFMVELSEVGKPTWRVEAYLEVGLKPSLENFEHYFTSM